MHFLFCLFFSLTLFAYDPLIQFAHVGHVQKEQLPHECGVALVRLKQPLDYYAKKYGDPAWGIKKLLSLMDKQRNRGQDGAGIAVVKFDMPQGQEYLHQLRSANENSLDYVYEHVMRDLQQPAQTDIKVRKQNCHYLGELMLGHLRYATHSSTDVKCCQPFVHVDTMASKHFALAGNFNMTNTQELFNQLHDWGLSLTSESDTHVILETIAYSLDDEFQKVKNQIDLVNVLKEASAKWDGGYVFSGILGNGDAFICRDPAGIRPGFYYSDDEVFAAASERVAIMDALDVAEDKVLPIKPGHVIVIKKNGEISETPFTNLLKEKQCSFERIYFSKASDPSIYEQRKALGRQLAQRVYEAIDGDLEHAIFTYIPNSSLCAFQGLVEEINRLARKNVVERIKKTAAVDFLEIERLASISARTEYLVAKNQKMRTFITTDLNRDSLVAQLYGVTKGVVTPRDTLVVIDDSIVRGTTLRESLVKKLIGLNPKKIVIVSSAPPVMYPDCYGIDMSQLGRFVAFQAALALLKERTEMHLLKEIEASCLKQQYLPANKMQNELKRLYDHFSLEELSDKIAQLVTPTNINWKNKVQVIYQTIDGLHQSMPGFEGDWYFTGEYPTPGGFRVLNTSYLNWCENLDVRSY